MRLTLEIPTIDLDAYGIVLVDYPQPVEWLGPMPPIGSGMTIVGVKHEVVKYSYDVEYDISVDQAMPQSRAAIDAPYGYMRCTGTESGYQSMTPIRLSKA